MSRTFLLLLAALPVMASPKDNDSPKEPLYFPTKEGATRVLVISVKGGTPVKDREETETVSRVERRHGAYHVTLEKTSATLTEPESVGWEVSAKGLRGLLYGEPSPNYILKVPFKEGETWKAGTTITQTIGKEEEIEVPAGKFRAVSVTSLFETADGKIRKKITNWYAIGIGSVKRTSLKDGVETTTALKSFTPGKESDK